MADTNFIDQKTVIEADWLNDVNQLAYSKTYPDGTHSPTSESLATPSGASGVGFQQSGTGAVLRTVEGKLSETLSAGDFGDADNVGNVVLNVPSQFASVSAALDYLKGRTIAAGTTVQIKIADGTYTLSASIYAAHPNGDQIEIIGNEANPELCVLQASTSDGIYLPAGFRLKRLNGVKFVNTTVKSAATPYLGILTDGGTYMKVGPRVIVDNFYYGLAARNGGKIFAPGDATNHVVVTNAGDIGIWAFNNSFVDCRYADVSYCDDYAANGLGGGIVAEFSSNIQANNVRTHHNALCGFSVLSGSSIRAWSSISDYNKHGVITGSNGVIELFGTPACIVSNNTEYGLYSGDGRGHVFGADAVSFSGNALGNTFSRFEFASNGALTVKAGTVTLDTLKPGVLTDGNAYYDMNVSASNFAILRALVAGVEKGRIQYDAANNKWRMSANGVTVAEVRPDSLASLGSLKSDGGANDAYVDMLAGTGKFGILRYLVNAAEKARIQYDGVNDILSVNGNSKTPFRFYPLTGKTTVGVGAPATNATSGLLQVPVSAGQPTGVISDVQSGFAPMVVDSTNSKLWFYIGGVWKSVTLA